jgi:hypothetical protein
MLPRFVSTVDISRWKPRVCAALFRSYPAPRSVPTLEDILAMQQAVEDPQLDNKPYPA